MEARDFCGERGRGEKPEPENRRKGTEPCPGGDGKDERGEQADQEHSDQPPLAQPFVVIARKETFPPVKKEGLGREQAAVEPEQEAVGKKGKLRQERLAEQEADRRRDSRRAGVHDSRGKQGREKEQNGGKSRRREGKRRLSLGEQVQIGKRPHGGPGKRAQQNKPDQKKPDQARRTIKIRVVQNHALPV